jgi:hypothetical protein
LDYKLSLLDSNATASDIQKYYYQQQQKDERKRSAGSNGSSNSNRKLNINGRDQLLQLKCKYYIYNICIKCIIII